MDQREKDIWVDEVMNSLHGIKRAASADDMYDGVMDRLKTGNKRAGRLLPRIAVAAAVLLTLNIATAYKMSRIVNSADSGNAHISQMIDEQITNLDSY